MPVKTASHADDENDHAPAEIVDEQKARGGSLAERG